ncbi:MAG: lipoate--protein ligase family protein [Deltaproteobacteria bacterium]|nr:lipoate--protein ligase family protein [Deltaproteobacteria bacterium]
MRPLELLEDAVPGEPALDTAVSRALLDAVAAGERPETLRLYRPDDVVAFSGLDRASPGFARAVAAARAQGFDAALRLAGGRAAVFQTGSLAFAWAMPATELRGGIEERFEAVAGWVAAALRRLGVDARVGEVPGEYCPGAHSVNARGRVKLMGVGQRVVRGAAHVGGVVVVGGSGRVRGVLGPVYAALGLPFDPVSAGAVEDEIGPIGPAAVGEALLGELGRLGFAPRPAPAGTFASLRARAGVLEPRFRVPACAGS